ncbi:MAG TPA: hypothetical protein VLH35_01535 [Candidatus Acidoferrales bacterium]|nr:hypothetical protein [Candidatus Acidoferrales bacterium]
MQPKKITCNNGTTPGYVHREGEHTTFVKKVGKFQTKFEAGQAALSIEILTFLKNWVGKYIQVKDKKYSAFFNNRGLKK